MTYPSWEDDKDTNDRIDALERRVEALEAAYGKDLWVRKDKKESK